MKVFADALQGVLASPGSVDVTIQNEVNTTPCVTQDVYASLYVALDGELRGRSLRSRVRFIGGDLLRGGVLVDLLRVVRQSLRASVDAILVGIGTMLAVVVSGSGGPLRRSSATGQKPTLPGAPPKAHQTPSA